MLEATVAELRKHTKTYLDAVEEGGVVRLYRRGKPIAEIVPLRSGEPAWKREVSRVSIPGLSLAREILKDRVEPGT